MNDRKLDALIRATTDDMQKAEMAVLRRANDAYRKTIFNAQVYANTGAGTYEKAVDMAMKDFLAAGIQCVVYKTAHNIPSLTMRIWQLRTASKRAYPPRRGDEAAGVGYFYRNHQQAQWGLPTLRQILRQGIH